MSSIDKHDWLVIRDYQVRLICLVLFKMDNPYDLVLLVILARLACLGSPRVSTTLLLFACHGQL